MWQIVMASPIWLQPARVLTWPVLMSMPVRVHSESVVYIVL